MKNFKRVISVILVLSMLLSVFTVAAFAEEQTPASGKSDAEYPIVFVTGIGQSYSYFYENKDDVAGYYETLEKVKNGTAGKNADGSNVRETDNATARWNLFCNNFSFAFKEPATIFAIIRVAVGLLASMIGINLIPRSAVNYVVKTLFRYNIIDKEGNLPENVITPRADCSVAGMTEEQRENFYRSIPCEDVISGVGEDMIYCFNYSAFSFTYNNAKDLDTFINDVVLKQTGKDKVVLVPMSMGASVVSAYLQDYGTKAQVAKVVSIVGAWNGSDVFADLIEHNFAADAPDKLYHGLVSGLIGEPWGYIVNFVLRLFPKKTLRSIIDEIVDGLVDELVLKTPSLLALIPAERYQTIREKYLAPNEDLKYIMDMTDKYYECQAGLEERLKMLNSEYGVEFYYIAGYGLEFGGSEDSDYEFFKFMGTTTTTNSDEIIQISSTATGATVVKSALGTQVSQPGANAVLTPDGSVDISTCYFPTHVWLFKNQRHELQHNNIALRLALDLACGVVSDNSDTAYAKFNDQRYFRSAKSNLKEIDDYIANGGTLTADQQKAYDDAIAVRDSGTANWEEDNKVFDALYNVLVELGKKEAKTPSGESDGGFLKKADDAVYKVFGAKGFRDILNPTYW